MTAQRLLKLLVVTDIYASLISVAVPLIAATQLGIPLTPLAASLVFFQSLSIYALNRQVDQEIDSTNNPERTRFVLTNGRIILLIALAGFLISMFYAFQASMPAFLLLSANFIASLFYSFPVFPRRLGFTRFKDVLIGKNLCVGAMYAAYSFLPALFAGAPLGFGAASIALFMLARFFIVSTVFDLRDVEGDSRLGIKTIPVAFGRGATLLWLHALNAASLALVFISCAFGALPPAFALPASATALFALYYLLQSGRAGADLRFICGIVAEADIVPAAIAAMLLTY